MRQVQSFWICFGFVGLAMSVAVGRADSVAYNPGSPFEAVSGSGDLVMDRFTTSQAIEITALGTGNTVVNRSASLALGLYDDAGNTLATVTLPTTGTIALDNSQFIELATPVQLSAGETFRVAGYYTSGTFYQILSPTLNSVLSFDNGYFDPFATSLTGSVADVWKQSQFSGGPNFEFTLGSPPAAAPLPSTAYAGLGLLGGLGVLTVARRRVSAAKVR